MKSIFHVFKGFSAAKNCLRSESAPLSRYVAKIQSGFDLEFGTERSELLESLNVTRPSSKATNTNGKFRHINLFYKFC